MPRPTKPIPVWTDLTYQKWAEEGYTLQEARKLRENSTVRALLTIMVNERPSASGNTDASYCLGYESAIALVKRFLDGAPAETAPRLERHSYAVPETENEMNWK